MPTNDTANIYSSEYRNGGTPSTPTTAADVTYDNTTSGLTADDVQEAIDEVNTDLQSTKDDVGDLKTALVGNYTFVDLKTITVTADGVKTISDLLNSLYTLLMTDIQNLDDDEAIKLTSLSLEGFMNRIPAQSVTYYDKTTTSVSMTFSSASIAVSSGKIAVVSVSLSVSPTINLGEILTTPAVTVQSNLTDVPTSGRKYSVLYELIKRV